MQSQYLALLLIAVRFVGAAPAPQAIMTAKPSVVTLSAAASTPTSTFTHASQSFSALSNGSNNGSCEESYANKFTITVVPKGSSHAKRQELQQINDGQVQNLHAATVATAAPAQEYTTMQVHTYASGTPYTICGDNLTTAPVEAAVAPLSQMNDSQAQNLKSASTDIALASVDGAPLSQINDGQVQNIEYASVSADAVPVSIDAAPVSVSVDVAPAIVDAPPLSQINDGQIQNIEHASVSADAAPASFDAASVSADIAPLSQINDGQVQNIAAASAQTQEYTTMQVKTYAPGIPYTVCGDNVYTTSVGSEAAPLSQISDGQVQNFESASITTDSVSIISDAASISTDSASISTDAAPLSQINDGQVQNIGRRQAPLFQINDGQIQNIESASAPSVQSVSAPSSQTGDGQVQNIASDSAPIAQSVSATLSPINDGQVQNIASTPAAAAAPASNVVYASVRVSSSAPAGHSAVSVSGPATSTTPLNQIASMPAAQSFSAPLSQINDGQVQNIGSAAPAAASLSQINDGHVQKIEPVHAPITQLPDGQPQNLHPLHRRQAPGNPSFGAKPLYVSLSNGILTDESGRTGYIADNNQFQFDGPPQATPYAVSGFAVCDDNTLALNGSNTFYQCRSGDFSNLYDSKIAEHCEAVEFVITPAEGN